MKSEKEVEALKAEQIKKIEWLKDFINRWDFNENHNYPIEQGILIDEYSKWLSENGQMEGAIADELLEELEAQLVCIEDGKF